MYNRENIANLNNEPGWYKIFVPKVKNTILWLMLILNAAIKQILKMVNIYVSGKPKK